MAMMSGLQNALSGMKTAQSQLELVGKNIANVDTPGYTRKTAQSQSVILAGASAGVKLGDITRNVSEGLLKSFLSSNSMTGSLASQSSFLGKTEMLLGNPQSNNSLSANVSGLQAAFNTFSTDVTSSAGRFNLTNQAKTLTTRLNSLTNEIQKLRGDADMAIKASVDSINTTLTRIAELNSSIVKYNVLNYEGAADLMDQRDAALKELSSQIDISYFTRDSGELVIQTNNGVTLLDREPHFLSHSPIAQAGPTSSYAGGSISGIFVDGKDVTSKIKEGEIKGFIEIRDVVLPSLQSQMDELAGQLKNAVNQSHNTGTSYPAGSYSLSGTRTFIDPANQQITISGGDVRISIFDKDGKEFSTTTLVGNLGFTNGSIDDMAAEVQNWMRNTAGLPQAEVFVDDAGKLQMRTGDSNYSLSLVDEASSTPGSAQQDVKIAFDVDGNGTAEREFSGFSNFFGMNDFFVSNTQEAIYDSKVVAKNANLGVANTVVLGFADANNPRGMGSITVFSNDSLQDIVNKINNDPDLSQQLNASLVPNGNGYVLRIVNSTGEQIEITDGNSGLVDRLGLKPSNVGLAGSISVREDLLANPSKISAGSPEFNTATGQYQMNPAANNVATAMSKIFSGTLSFGEAGTIAATQTTLANYAATFVGNIASQTNNAEASLQYQAELTNAIATKEAKMSGVDMDEELSQLIVYQQTYAACAQSFTASKEMLDMLLGMMG